MEEETGNTDPKSTFRLIVIQTELERFKYLVRSFVRARISKVGMLDSFFPPFSHWLKMEARRTFGCLAHHDFLLD